MTPTACSVDRVVECHVRNVVAETLGVEADALAPEISLVDELAADSLDMAEMAAALEVALGVAVPEGRMEAVRTYADLVEVACGLGGPPPLPPLRYRALIRPAMGLGGPRVVRSGWLTAHALETLAADALRLGWGTRLRLSLRPGVGRAVAARIENELAWLRTAGVDVIVREGRRVSRRVSGPSG